VVGFGGLCVLLKPAGIPLLSWLLPSYEVSVSAALYLVDSIQQLMGQMTGYTIGFRNFRA